jgi:hypothetical protein
MRKLVAMRTEVETARQTTPAAGIARDIDIVAQRVFKGKRVKARLTNGEVVWGEVSSVMNAGFNGIIVHILVGTGTDRVPRIASMDKCRVWAER